jgi:hypothetical protein
VTPATSAAAAVAATNEFIHALLMQTSLCRVLLIVIPQLASARKVLRRAEKVPEKLFDCLKAEAARDRITCTLNNCSGCHASGDTI